MTRDIERIESLPWPEIELSDNFSFFCSCAAGSLELTFRWLNERWNLWVELPDGSVREAGVQPNVTSWSGFSDWGFFVKADLSRVDYSSLFLCELYLITWR